MDKLHYLATIPRIDGRDALDDLGDATRALVEAVADQWDGPVAPPVRMLPGVLPSDELPAPQGAMRMALGLAEKDLSPVWHDFSSHPHLTILGDTGSGKSAALRLVARAITSAYSPDEVEVILVDTRRALTEDVPDEYRRGAAYSVGAAVELLGPAAAQLRERLPGVDVTAQQLARRDWWTGKELYVLVDDYDLLMSAMGGGPLDPLADLLPQAVDIGLHVVLTRAAAGSSRTAMDATIRRLQESNTPDLALSCPPTEMPLLNGVRGRLFPPGRGMLLTRRSTTQLQVGWTEPGLGDDQ